MSFFRVLFAAFISILAYQNIFAMKADVVVTRDPSLYDRWYLTLGESVPRISMNTDIIRGEKFDIVIFFSDYSIDAKSNADVTYDIKMTDPKGKTYLEKKGAKAVKAKIDNDKAVLLSTENFKVSFDPVDLVGEYQVNATVYDRVANTSVTASQKFTMREVRDAVYFKNDNDFEKWMMGYYLKPDPEKAVDGYLYYAASKLSDDNNTFVPAISFFKEIFSYNPFLLNKFVSIFPQSDPKTRIYILYLLSYCKYDISKISPQFSDNERSVYNKITSQKLPDPYGNFTDPSQIDALWGIFYASGSFKPVRKIVDAFSLSGYVGSMKKKDDKSEAFKQNVIKELIYKSGVWSLGSNASNNQLVWEYCDYIYEKEKLSPDVKKALGEILDKAKEKVSK